jgi:excisionase family DNA binding protein
MNEQEDKRLSVCEAAQYLGVSFCTIYRYLHTGALRGEYPRVGKFKEYKRWSIWVSDLDIIIGENSKSVR